MSDFIKLIYNRIVYKMTGEMYAADISLEEGDAFWCDRWGGAHKCINTSADGTQA